MLIHENTKIYKALMLLFIKKSWERLFKTQIIRHIIIENITSR